MRVPASGQGPGLPARIAVAKFDDHLPLYRQAEIFACDGVEFGLARRDCGHAAIPDRLLRREVISGSDVPHGDDTPIPVRG
ncbi:IS66 family transposase [Methylobacterium frigidaeris]|uniref:Transposase IS66 central domain-containing protein n=1 Tax=Methylobacterium frigidaeris TaxID=2038277 RepID=A0AA37HHP9_9HYPH|nr:hypothetical protein MPEAHAMD_6367 [Methylobacterium frigidaeris]